MNELHFRLKAGLDMPINGAPAQNITAGARPRRVALLGPDYPGLKPDMAVSECERVSLGQLLAVDRHNPALRLTAPASGRISAISRGRRRILQNIVIELQGDHEIEFSRYLPEHFAELERAQVIANLVKSGLWSALRTRPFSRVPRADTEPHALFVSAMDTNPLAADPATVIATRPQAFLDGLSLISRLTDGPVYVCRAPDSVIPVPPAPQLRVATFYGPHPAGLVGTHIHFLDPIGEHRSVWHIGYQDVMAVGHLFRSGRLEVGRVIALGGPAVHEPRLLDTRLGACLADLLRDEIADEPCRIVSGSLLSGRRAAGSTAFLGRYHTQVSVLSEASGERSFRSPQPMVPTGMYERVMPLDILPAPLLKALIIDDIDAARALGALELDQEDLALCSFVCAGKHDYGAHLQRALDRIEAEG